MSEEVLDRILDEVNIQPYYPPPVWMFKESKGGGSRRRKGPISRRSKMSYPYEVVMDLTGGGCSIKVYDHSRGYAKLVARASGLDNWEAEDMYGRIWEILREG